jgi:hypothetical protein
MDIKAKRRKMVMEFLNRGLEGFEYGFLDPDVSTSDGRGLHTVEQSVLQALPQELWEQKTQRKFIG